MTDLDIPTIARRDPDRASQIGYEQRTRMADAGIQFSEDTDNRPLVGAVGIVGVLVLAVVVGMTILAATLGAIR